MPQAISVWVLPLMPIFLKTTSFEDVSSLLGFFLSWLGLEVLSSWRLSSVPLLSLCSSLCSFSLTCPFLSVFIPEFATSHHHPLCFKTILSFKWISLQTPPSFLSLIFPFSSTWPSVKSSLVHLIQTVQKTWFWSTGKPYTISNNEVADFDFHCH